MNPPEILIVSGLTHDPKLYPKCSVLIRLLMKLLNISYDKFILLPHKGDKKHQDDFNSVYHSFFQKRYQAYRPDIITSEYLQLASIDVEGAEEQLFNMWDRDVQEAKKDRTSPARILVTTKPVSQWRPTPQTGFTQWRVEGPLLEITTAKTAPKDPKKKHQPFLQHSTTVESSCHLMTYTDCRIHTEFTLVAKAKVR